MELITEVNIKEDFNKSIRISIKLDNTTPEKLIQNTLPNIVPVKRLPINTRIAFTMSISLIPSIRKATKAIMFARPIRKTPLHGGIIVVSKLFRVIAIAANSASTVKRFVLAILISHLYTQIIDLQIQ